MKIGIFEKILDLIFENRSSKKKSSSLEKRLEDLQ